MKKYIYNTLENYVMKGENELAIGCFVVCFCVGLIASIILLLLMIFHVI